MARHAQRFAWFALLASACSSAEPLPTVGSEEGGVPGETPADSCRDPSASCEAFSDERPSRLSEHAAAHVAERQELVVFGGTRAIPQMCEFPAPDYSATTFIYSERCGGWRWVEGSGPGPRARAMAAYGGGLVWVFGGRFREPGSTSGAYELYDELWTFDAETEQWDLVPVAGERPAARTDGALAYDSRRGLLWLIGGNASDDGAVYAPLDDVWSFDPSSATWTPHAPTGDVPPARMQHAMLYDAGRDRLVTFGGADESAFLPEARYASELSALDLEPMTWSVLHNGAEPSPGGRFWTSLAHDLESDAYLVAGGHDDQMLGNRNDVWRFDPNLDSWSEANRGDTFNNPIMEFCAPPYDFATVDLSAPERRMSHTFVWSEGCGRALLFAGKTDCGAIDDLWAYEQGRWNRLLQATEGEACWRAGGDPELCLSLCR